jgi:hypothetical protein
MEERKFEATFPSRPRVELFAKWLMFTAAILFMAIMAMFYPVEANIPLIVVPSILVLIFAKPVFFEKLKLTTLVLMRIIIVFAAFRLFNPQVYVDVILLMLIINILEATFTDLLKHKKYFNAISGFALAVGVIALKGSWAYGAPIGNYYLVYGPTFAVTFCYVIAYTLWNWIFVTDEFSPSVSLMHVGFLTAPIFGCLATLGLGAFGGFGMWLLLRANTLSIGGWLQISSKGWFEREFYSPKFAAFIAWTHKSVPQIIFMVINLALIATCIGIAASMNAIGYTPASWTI